MKKAALIVGAGPGTGAAVARRFAREGLTVCVARRTKDEVETLAAEIRAAGGAAEAFALNTRHEEGVGALVTEIETRIGPLEVAVFNAARRMPKPFLELTGDDFDKSYETNIRGGFFVIREAARAMLPRGRGTILVTGATASVRGRQGFAAFASTKGGLRLLTQAAARELGPKGLHIAHVVIDGAIDTAFIRGMVPGIKERLGEDGLLAPDAIADAYWSVHKQPRSAWTHEMDLRPYKEVW